MQHAYHRGGVRVANQRPSIVLRVPGVDYDGTTGFSGERDLRGKRGALELARRIIVVVVEAALADCHRSFAKELAQPGYVSRRVERSGIVRVDPRRREDEALIVSGDRGRDRRGID